MYKSSFLTLLTALLILAGVTLLSISVFRVTADITYRPVVMEAMTPTPTQESRFMRLHDDVFLEQTFTAPEDPTSHLGIGIANFRAAPSTARVTVDVLENATVIASHTLGVGELRNDDITRIPLPITLSPQRQHILVLKTTGVPATQSLTVFYEIDDSSFPEGNLTQTRSDHSSQRVLAGNIRFQLLRLPTSTMIIAYLVRSPLFWLTGLYFFVVGALLLVKPVRTWFASRLTIPMDTTPGSISVRYVIVLVLIGLALSAYVTFPYYTSPTKGSTPIDLQRALVYRGVARDGIINDHKVNLWEPYLCGGMTMIGNMESVHFDPFIIPVLLFGDELGLRLGVTLTFMLGFVGATLLARRLLNINRVAAMSAGLIFVFSGFQMLAFSEYFFAWMPVGWMPWFFLALFESIRKPHWVIGSSAMLVFIIFGGSIHMAVFSIGAAFLFMLTLSVIYKQPKPLLMYFLSLVITLPVVAIKMIPVTATQALTDTFVRPPSFIPPLSWLPKMFLSRGQIDLREFTDPATGEMVHWLEYGSYVGFLTPVLIGIGLVLKNKKKMLYAVLVPLVVTLAMVFGYFPWSALHTLPVFSEILRDPSRIRGITLLFIGLLTAWGLSSSFKKIFPERFLQNAGATLVVIILTLDLLSLHAPLFRDQFFTSFPKPRPQQQFDRIHEAYALGIPGYYEVYKNNRGTTDQCFNQLKVLSGHARGVNSSDETQPYRGEIFLLNNKGSASLKTFSPDRITTTVASTTNDWLVLNANYLPGWKTIPPREVMAKEGLIAARITPEDRELSFVYEPLAYTVGKVITMVTLLCLAGYYVFIRYRNYK